MSIKLLKSFAKLKFGWFVLVFVVAGLLYTFSVMPFLLVAAEYKAQLQGAPDPGTAPLLSLLALQLVVEAGIGYGMLRYMPHTGSFYLGLRVVVVGLLLLAFLFWVPWVIYTLVHIGPNPEGLFG